MNGSTEEKRCIISNIIDTTEYMTPSGWILESK
jgi:hypothetical protein